MRKIFYLLSLSLISASGTGAQELVTYPAPQGVIYSQHNDDYTVKVRKQGGEWQDLFEYNVQVDLDKPQDASMVYFDHGGPVEVAVRKNNGHVQSVNVRPASYGIQTTLQGNTVFFTLAKPSKVSVEFNGDRLHNLHVFGNPIEKDKPHPKDPNVIYFGPGVHQPKDLPGDEFNIPAGKTVYIAGGAVVKAKLVCDRVSNVRIMGRGILLQPQRGVEVRHSSNVSIEGIIVVNPKHYTVYGGGSDKLTIRNIKSFSANGWSDGIDLMSCSDVTIDDVFMRNSDDCIAIYGHRWDYYGNARNYSVTNSILWADIAHPINIGLHGDTEKEGEVIENLVFKNIDILEQDEDDPDYQGCLAISNGDLNLVRNITFEDIRIEDFQEGQLLNLRVVNNAKYNTGPGRGIENIVFRNISYHGVNLNPSIIQGLDEGHAIKNITFENLRINGKLVNEAAAANIRIGTFVKDVTFKKGNPSTPISISSLKELAEYAAKSGNEIKMKPGLYKMIEFLNPDSIKSRVQRKSYQYIDFTGSNNQFNLEGVHIEIDTKLRQYLKHPIHTDELVVSGNDNTFDGLKVTCIGNGTSPGGALWGVSGRGNTVRNFTLWVQGSFPYGYGDLFGKGGPDVIRHQKHSGVHVTGSDTEVYRCKLYMRSFGHGFYIQNGAANIHFEDCYVEGELRKTDDVLKETSGPAFDVGFRTWTANREGKYVVTPGYMKSLCEDGFRTYGEIKNVSFKNCTAKNTRGGFELRTNGGIRLENCTTIGTERAFWVGNNAVVKHCKGDANYGPLLFVEGSHVDVEMTVMPAVSDRVVHALATIQGSNNKVVLKSAKGQNRSRSLPVMVGYTHPEHGESMSPYGEGNTTNLQLINETIMPVVIGEKASDGTIITNGPVEANKGKNMAIKKGKRRV